MHAALVLDAWESMRNNKATTTTTANHRQQIALLGVVSGVADVAFHPIPHPNPPPVLVVQMAVKL